MSIAKNVATSLPGEHVLRMSDAPCRACGDILSAGDQCVVYAEKVGEEWDIVDGWCPSCAPDDPSGGGMEGYTDDILQHGYTAALVEVTLEGQNTDRNIESLVVGDVRDVRVVADA